MKKFTREVNLAEACMATEYVDWSEQPIHFSRDDHPPPVPRPGHAALVVEAQIGGFNMGKVLMDGGSGLNLLFASTLKVMGIPLGKISLEVIFGNRQLQEGMARIRSRRIRITVPRNPWS